MTCPVSFSWVIPSGFKDMHSSLLSVAFAKVLLGTSNPLPYEQLLFLKVPDKQRRQLPYSRIYPEYVLLISPAFFHLSTNL
jgi:hypothetical protein